MLKLALIGYGWAGSRHLAALQGDKSEGSEKARYIRVVTQSQDKARDIGETYDIDADGDTGVSSHGKQRYHFADRARR